MIYSKLDLKAYSLLEVLIVIALFSIISILVVPYSLTEIRNTNVASSASDLASSIYYSQQNAYSSKDNVDYGISLRIDGFDLFTGATSVSGNILESRNFSGGVRISSYDLIGGGNEILFTKGSVKPNASGTINVSDTNITYQININSEGFIDLLKL